jgi:hypothetical protein
MQHTHTRTITVTEAYVTCDRCGREMHPNNQDCEHQERLAVHFRAGYGSVFSDGSLVEADLCQHCVKEILGEWLRVTPDDPFELKKPSGGPKGAFQQYQLGAAIEAEDLRHELLKLLREKSDRPNSD